MTDFLSAEERSALMRRIKSKDTKPEMLVRRLVHRMGCRYRLHWLNLPGRPDLVFPGRRKVIEVRGCFWHRHPDPACRNALVPTTRRDYWEPKLARNVMRDAANIAALRSSGWAPLVIWECETRDQLALTERIAAFLGCSMPLAAPAHVG